MTEYRVVCDRDEHHNYSGADYHKEAVRPFLKGTPVNNHFKAKEDAEAFLERAIKECAVYDAKKQADDHRDNIKTWQYNFRIQSREVSEWK